MLSLQVKQTDRFIRVVAAANDGNFFVRGAVSGVSKSHDKMHAGEEAKYQTDSMSIFEAAKPKNGEVVVREL